MKKHYKTVIVSDIHIGKLTNSTDKLLEFLDSITMDTLILNGDIIDLRQLTMFSKWTDKETIFINHIVGFIKDGVHVKYIKGNHDTFIKRLLNLHIHNISIIKEYTHTTGNNKKYYICHGDRFDFICKNIPSLGMFINLLYSLLFLVERGFNKKLYNPQEKSFAEKIKIYLRGFANPKESLYKKALQLAEEKKCDGIIIGHYHSPAHIKEGNKEYFNTGDWIYSCSAIVENNKGELELIYHK